VSSFRKEMTQRLKSSSNGSVSATTVEEEVIEVLHRYSSNPLNPPVKPIVGFIAGQHASRGQIHGHAGAIWNKSSETAGSKMKLWREAGIRVADHIGMIGDLISAAAKELDRRKVS
jgi:succinyl-CoA synthetase alpha subunit